MRWGYLVPRVVVVAAVWAFFTFGFDPLLRWGAVQSGQKLTGAKAEVEGVRTTFFPPTISLGRVQLANQAEPMTNLVEFDAFQFRLEGEPLLRRKFVVQEGTLTGLKWGTPRSESGQLPAAPAQPPTEESGPGMFDGLGESAKEMAQDLGKDWLNELKSRAEMQADPNQFESVRLADGMYRDWTARFHAYEGRIKSIEAQVKQIEQTVKKAKGSTIERLQQYDQARREVNELLAEAERIRRELPELGKQANGDYKAIDAARKRDLAELRQKLDAFKLDAETISDALIGPELRARLAEAIDWVRWFRKKLAAVQDRPEPERLRGIDVDFSTPDELPFLVVRKLKLTGEASVGGEVMPFKGLVTNVTSDPRRLGRPAVLELYGKRQATVQVHAVIDHTAKLPVYDVAMSYSLPRRTEMQLGKKSEVVLNVAAQRTDWRAKLRLRGEELTGEVGMQQAPVLVTVEVERTMRPELKRVLQRALSGVNDVQATITLSGSYRHPKWKVRSNLGEQMSAGMSDVLSQELEAKRDELAQKVDAAAREKMDEFSTLLNGQFQELVADLNLNEQNAQQLIARLARNSGLNVDKLGDKLDLDKQQQELIRKAGLEKQLDLKKLNLDQADPKKLDPKKIDLKKLFN